MLWLGVPARRWWVVGLRREAAKEVKVTMDGICTGGAVVRKDDPEEGVLACGDGCRGGLSSAKVGRWKREAAL